MSTTLEQTPEKPGSKAIWIRGGYTLLFLVIGYVAIFVTFFIILLQFLSQIILKKPNEHLLHFGRCMGQYSKDIISFTTYNTEEMPFPFRAWPKAERGGFVAEKNHH